jgi:hypothetical protein
MRYRRLSPRMNRILPSSVLLRGQLSQHNNPEDGREQVNITLKQSMKARGGGGRQKYGFTLSLTSALDGVR